MISEILAALIRVNIVASVAILLVLALRPVALRWFGPRLTSCCWLIVPLAIAAGFLPSRQVIESAEPVSDVAVIEESSLPEEVPPRAAAALSEPSQPAFDWRTPFEFVLVAVWLAGAASLLARSIVDSRRYADDPKAGPALVGILRPRLLLPADFESRYRSDERDLILAHEERHRRRGHNAVNALVELARCASWFNPLAHMAAKRYRIDQELACDAAVIAAHPGKRRLYANALLKTQLATSYLPLVCTWTSRSAGVLQQRIALLARPSARTSRTMLGAGLLALVNLAAGYAVWAQAPAERIIEAARPAPVWTPSSEAPEGTLTHQLEAERHDEFIERAQAGNIDIVFFGSTDTEKWRWPVGRDVWEEAFGSLRAANFGSQGTGYRSLMWRMQNGELDGYQAKVIVLNPTVGYGGQAGYAANVAAIVEQVLLRQPQARILLVGPLPRPVDSTLWPWEAQNAALASLADDETVFFVDISDHFFNPDGSFNRQMSALGGSRTPAYEAWAQELQPWLDRFLR